MARENLEKVIKRGDNLSDLHDRAGLLSLCGANFLWEGCDFIIWDDLRLKVINYVHVFLRTENLRLTSAQFDASSRRLNRKLCWQNIKVYSKLIFHVHIHCMYTYIVCVAHVHVHSKGSSFNYNQSPPAVFHCGRTCLRGWGVMGRVGMKVS